MARVVAQATIGQNLMALYFLLLFGHGDGGVFLGCLL